MRTIITIRSWIYWRHKKLEIPIRKQILKKDSIYLVYSILAWILTFELFCCVVNRKYCVLIGKLLKICHQTWQNDDGRKCCSEGVKTITGDYLSNVMLSISINCIEVTRTKWCFMSWNELKFKRFIWNSHTIKPQQHYHTSDTS